MLKGIPLAYNKDMQEDKEAIFDSLETVKKCLTVFTPMLDSMKVNTEELLSAARGGLINATDLADYLAKKGIPFRAAYKTVGQIVGKCVAEGKGLEDLTLDEYKAFDPCFEADLFDAIDIMACVRSRNSLGGASPDQVDAQIEYIKGFLG